MSDKASVFDVRITFRAETGYEEKLIKNAIHVSFATCEELTYLEVEYMPCGDCLVEECECPTYSYYCDPRTVFGVEELPCNTIA